MPSPTERTADAGKSPIDLSPWRANVYHSMATEECAICGDSVPFATTTHVLVNPKHVEGVADHYVCRPCYDEHLEGLFAAVSDEEDVAEPLGMGDDDAAENGDGDTVADDAGTVDASPE